MKVNEIIEEIEKIKEREGPKKIKKFDFEQTQRILTRLDSYNGCGECKNFIEEFSSLFDRIQDRSIFAFQREYSFLIKKVILHFQKTHKLVPQSYYTNMYMGIGVAIGLSLGLVFSQALGQLGYMGIGLPIGIGIGVSVGSKLDTKAKKDSLVI